MADQLQYLLGNRLRLFTVLTLGIFLGFVGYYLMTVHTAHVYSALPYWPLLACLFMHLFMHGSHSGHGNAGGKDMEQHREHQHMSKDNR